MSCRNATVVCLFTIVASAAPLYAQIDVDRFSQTTFNFSPPGARAAGLDGAFTGIADDATAVESNPAGLTILLYPEMSFEFKVARNSTTIAERAGGGPGGRSFDRTHSFPSFASVVVPIGILRLAASYAKIVDVGGDQAANGYALNISGEGGVATGGYVLPWYSQLDWTVSNLGIGAAIKIGEGLSIGATGGISRQHLVLDQGRYLVNDKQRGFLDNRSRVGDPDSRSARYGSVGAMGRFRAWSAGLTYKRRPRFTDLHVIVSDINGTTFPGYDNRFSMKLPDAIVLGIGVRPSDRVTAGFTAERIRYSQLAEEGGQSVTARGDIVGGGADLFSTLFRADDGIDYRAGVEWVGVAGSTPYALRAGAAWLSSGNVYYHGPHDVIEEGLWGTSRHARTAEAGAGIGARIFRFFQVDVAGVVGKNRKELVASFVVVREAH